MTNREFVDISNLYPDFHDCGDYIIVKNKISQSTLDNIKVDSPFFPYKSDLKTDKEYVSLVIKSTDRPMMSSHETETITNQKFLDKATGDVLIFGLGLGLIVFPILESESITSIDIVELNSGLIDFVGELIKSKDRFGKVNIVEGDVFTFHEKITKKYDTIYIDIWEFVGEKELLEIEQFHETYSKFLNKNGWIDSWRSEKKLNYGI